MVAKAIPDSARDQLYHDYWVERIRSVPLAKKYNTTPDSLYAALHRFGIPLRGTWRTANDAFFDELTPASAWVLGLWVTDGNLSSTNGQYIIRIGFNNEDLTRRVHALFGATGKIGHSMPKDYWNFRITSRTLYDALMKRGLRERKTTVATLPTVEPELLPHLVRGVMDGDGCIYVRHRTKNRYRDFTEVVFTISTAAHDLLVGLQAAIQEATGLHGNLRHVHATRCDLAYYCHEAIMLGRWMYRNSEGIRHESKYAKFLPFLIPIQPELPLTSAHSCADQSTPSSP